jgi:hypothetical protein
MRWTALMIACAFASSAWANDVGQVKVSKGAAHIEREGARLAASVGMPIRQSDTLLTGPDGSLGVTFADNSLLSIGPNSVLAVDKFAFNPVTHDGQFDTSLKRGTLAVVSGKMVKQSPDAMRVRTPASILGVRGTEFVVKIEEPGK